MIELPKPGQEGSLSVEKALRQRRSIRGFSNEALSLGQIGQVLWAAQGVSNEVGFRNTPSAGATFPLECFLAAGEVTGMAVGFYHYEVREHALRLVLADDKRASLAHASLNQDFIGRAPAVLVIAADFSRTVRRYSAKGRQYVCMEAGHAAQNVHLQCESLGLGTVCIGAFNERIIQKILEMTLEPLYIMPLGRAKS